MVSKLKTIQQEREIPEFEKKPTIMQIKMAI